MHGNRRSPENAGILHDSDSDDTNYDTDRINLAETDADLQVIVEQWSELPDAVKAGILAMVRATGILPVDG
ncbi:MAG: hypothetical protein VX768_12010 [Planctomycetota bacterium]|nr:hypothetical protein [Planctomycetota bacterium]